MGDSMEPIGLQARALFNGSNGLLGSGVASAFVTWLKSLIDDKFESRRAFIRAAEGQKREEVGQGYLGQVLRDKNPKPPPLERIEAWANALGLKDADLQRFIDLAAIAHLPEEVQPRFVRLLDDVKDLRTLAEQNATRIAKLQKRGR